MVEIINNYEVYKDSGVEWLGQIPKHWEVVPGLSFIYENKEKNTGMKRNTVLSLSYGNIRVKGGNELTGLVPESFETYQFVNKGDLIFRPTDLQNDTVSLRSSISEYEGIITNAYLNLRFKSKANSKFFHYFFRAIDNNKIIYGLGSGLRQNISYLDFRRFQFPFPPPREQTAIAAFLDDKTAKIEQAVAIKEQQIALLKERKQIIIQETVTKGLDKTVKLKDSGVEWIGMIPEHWEILDIRRITTEHRQGYYTTEGYVDNGIKLLRITDFRKDGNLDITECPKVKEVKEVNSYILSPGDFIFARTGGAGNFAVFKNCLEKVAFASYLIRFRFDLKKITIDYLKYYFTSSVFLIGIERNIHGGVNQNIHAEDIKSQKIAIPPIKEQINLSKHIETQSLKIDQAIAIKEQEIEKLKEYKMSLIDAVVTGKVRVC